MNTHFSCFRFVLFIDFTRNVRLMGTAPPTQKLACFVLFLKIISIFLKNDICILYQIV